VAPAPTRPCTCVCRGVPCVHACVHICVCVWVGVCVCARALVFAFLGVRRQGAAARNLKSATLTLNTSIPENHFLRYLADESAAIFSPVPPLKHPKKHHFLKNRRIDARANASIRRARCRGDVLGVVCPILVCGRIPRRRLQNKFSGKK